MAPSETRRSFLWYPWIVCGLAALFYTYEYVLRITPSVMTHELMMSFGISAAALGNLSAFYYYAFTPMQMPVGVLMDRFGPRRLLILACLACALGSALFVCQTFYWAALGRFLVGFGSAFAFVGVLKLAAMWHAPDKFALISGLCTCLGMLGGWFGDNVLSPSVGFFGWRPLF